MRAVKQYFKFYGDPSLKLVWVNLSSPAEKVAFIIWLSIDLKKKKKERNLAPFKVRFLDIKTDFVCSAIQEEEGAKQNTMN